MKNLKKVLSLALVFAMVLGLCIGAMAADTQKVTELTDWDSVTHKEAAQLLNAFNIMQGYTDKTFRPDNTVTRAEAVKMIDVALWGGTDQAERFTGVGETTFSDVKSGDWYAGHVTYAEAIGILDGFPDGTFRPNDTVTGYQMLKMALIALNYNSEVEGLAGAGWDIRTMRLATDPSAQYSDTDKEAVANPYDLTAGLDDITNWNAPLTRDQAAQIIYNMIRHSTVTYSLMANGQAGNVKQFSKDSFGTLVLNMIATKGTLVGNSYGALKNGDALYKNADATKGNSIIKYTTSNDTEATLQVNTDSGLYDLGAQVVVYSKGKIDNVISVAITTPVEMVPAQDGSNMVEEPGEFTVGTAGTSKYTATKYFDTDIDGKIDFVNTVTYNTPTPVKAVIETETFGTVYQIGNAAWRTSYDDKSFDIASRSNNFLPIAGIDAVKGDIITSAPSTNASGATVNLGVVLSAVDGKITRVGSNTRNESVYYIDGDDGHTVIGTNTTDTSNTIGGAQVKFGVSGTFYLYPNGSIGYYAPEDNSVEANVALLYDAGYASTGASTAIGGTAGSATMSVAAILPDNTKTTFTLASIAKDATTSVTAEIKPNSKQTINAVLGGTSGALANLNNLDVNTNSDTVTLNGDSANYLVEYVLNSDGAMIITKIMAYDSASIKTEVKAGDSTVKLSDNTNALIVPDTVTFIQTSVAKADGTASEDWTVAIGSTAAYQVLEDKAVSVVLDNYNYTSTKYVAYAVVAAGTTKPVETKSTFYYVIANNGQVAQTATYDEVYEIVYFDADANKIVTAQMTVDGIVPGTFYTTLDGQGNFTGNPIDFATSGYATGYVTGYAGNILGLTHFEPADKLESGKDHFKSTVNSYVVTKDTEFYFIDGSNSEEIGADEVSVQGYADPIKAFAKKTDGTDDETKTVVTVTYGAVVVVNSTNTSVADKVIIFAKDQTGATQTYTTETGAPITE